MMVLDRPTAPPSLDVPLGTDNRVMPPNHRHFHPAHAFWAMEKLHSPFKSVRCVPHIKGNHLPNSRQIHLQQVADGRETNPSEIAKRLNGLNRKVI